MTYMTYKPHKTYKPHSPTSLLLKFSSAPASFR